MKRQDRQLQTGRTEPGRGARVTCYLGVGEIPGRFCNRKSSLHTLSLHSGNPPVHRAEGTASKIW